MSLDERMEVAGKRLLEREARHAAELDQARAKANDLHGRVAAAITRFNDVVSSDLPSV